MPSSRLLDDQHHYHKRDSRERDKSDHRRKRKHSSSSRRRRSESHKTYERSSDLRRHSGHGSHQSNNNGSYSDLSRCIKRKVDQEKLLFIARSNLLRMIKNSELPPYLPIDQVRLPPEWLDEAETSSSHTKTLQDLTDICKTVSMQDTENEKHGTMTSKEEFHHPFTLKERKEIHVRVPKFSQLKCRSSKEIQKDLLQKFPVSSGSVHRDLEWEPIKLESMATKTKKDKQRLDHSGTDNALHSQDTSEHNPDVDFRKTLSQGIHTIRKSHDDLHNSINPKQMLRPPEKKNWKGSKSVLGQFTGSTGANVLTPAELEPQFPVWTKKDQFRKADRIKDGIGMHLLQKMGWQEGEGLGLQKRGALEPVIPTIKFDTKGLAAEDEKFRKTSQKFVSSPDGDEAKNPISILNEYCAHKKWPAPHYRLIHESGPSHKPNFIMKVTVNNVEYQPTVPETNKKQAKALAAFVCLQAFKLLP